MSGHSKWANIKHRKQSVDAKKGKVFTRLAKEIIVAAKLGGADEDSNPRLKSAILKARSANMPKNNINRAIKKGSGELNSENYEEITYEAYGPGGVALIIEVVTDKKSRTVPEIKNILSKAGGSLAESGAVGYLFNHRGLIFIETIEISEDSLFEKIVEAGADDLEKDDDLFVVQIKKEMFHDVVRKLSDSLNEKDAIILEYGLKYVPNTFVDLDVKMLEDKEAQITKLIEQLEDHDDIQSIYTNLK